MAKNNAGYSGIVGAVAPLAEPITAELGLLLWDIRFVKEGATWILRVVIDREDGPVSIDDCVSVSRRLSPLLDEADPIEQSYCLEVTSPGADRELTRPEHYAYYEGYLVTAKLFAPDASGRREITGILISRDSAELVLQTDEDETQTLAVKAVASVHAVDEWEAADEEDAEADE